MSRNGHEDLLTGRPMEANYSSKDRGEAVTLDNTRVGGKGRSRRLVVFGVERLDTP